MRRKAQEMVGRRILMRAGLLAFGAGAFSLPAAPAAASPGDWVVTQGGVRNVSITQPNLVNKTSGLGIFCKLGSVTASLPNKSDASAVLGSLTSVSIQSSTGSSSCQSYSENFKVTPQGAPWALTGVSYTSPVTNGKLSGIKFQLTSGTGCEATLAGPSGGTASVDVVYDNSNGRLALRSGPFTDLRVWSTNGLCDPLLLGEGDSFALGGDIQFPGAPAGWPQIVKLP